jgi:hypothetical protein
VGEDRGSKEKDGCPLTSTANDASAITDIANVILCYENHSEHPQLAVTHLEKQSLILGYNWLQNHNPEINWQTKELPNTMLNL